MRFARVMLACAALVTVGADAARAAGAQLVFVVRHAERAIPAAVPGAAGAAMTGSADDPPLSASGHERAERLAGMLRSADVRYIFSTEFLRARQTAAPMAQALGLDVITVSSREAGTLLAQVRQRKGNVLIVGHSNTVPDVLKGLGIKGDVTIGETEFDNLFVVVRPDAGEPTLIRLRY